MVSGIKTAEAVKVVENSQRDINIAFMNEIAMICDRMHIDTDEANAAKIATGDTVRIINM